MPTTYSPPELIRFGKVEALTASNYKCSPGTDAGFELTHIFQSVTHTPSGPVVQYDPDLPSDVNEKCIHD